MEPRATSALDADFRAFYATVPRASLNALHPDAQHLRALYVLARSMQPMNILDLGSGYSTLALAAACRDSAWGRVAAVDGMAEWGARTTAMLAATGLSAWAKVIVREPVEVNVDGRRAWDFPDLPDSFFGLVHLDGPALTKDVNVCVTPERVRWVPGGQRLLVLDKRAENAAWLAKRNPGWVHIEDPRRPLFLL